MTEQMIKDICTTSMFIVFLICGTIVLWRALK